MWTHLVVCSLSESVCTFCFFVELGDCCDGAIYPGIQGVLRIPRLAELPNIRPQAQQVKLPLEAVDLEQVRGRLATPVKCSLRSLFGLDLIEDDLYCIVRLASTYYLISDHAAEKFDRE